MTLSYIPSDTNDEGIFKATASGILPNGKPVVVNADGTVSVPFNATTIFAQEAANSISIATNGSGTFVIMYTGPASSYAGKAIAGTISGNTVTLGSAATFVSESNITINGASIVYDPDSAKFILFYPDGSNSYYLTSRVATVSGTSISFGTAVVMDSRNVTINSAAYDTNANKVVCAWRGTSSNIVAAAAGTVSGTNISFGSTATLASRTPNTSIATVYDANANKTAVFYQDNSTGHGYYVVGTVSGTSISGGSTAAFAAAGTSHISASYDSTAQKIVIAFSDTGSSNGSAVVGTISNTSISFGSEATLSSSAADATNTAYDSTNNKTFIFYDKGNAAMTGRMGTISGTSISFGTETTITSGNSLHTSAVYDASAGKALLAYRRATNSDYGTLQALDTTFATTNFTAENYIGISTGGTYASGSTATVKIIGNTSDEQTSLTAGQAYYVQTDGTIGTTAASPSVFAGTAISATKLIVKT